MMKSSEIPPSKGRTEGQTKALFIARLERLLRMRKGYREDLNPLGLRLMDRAIDATYSDCVDFGAGIEARAIMSRHSAGERGNI
ncbi:MAG: hypothetical protein GEU75_10990 [Dehalococcoidia bacterium]|nr:hypothetical protein [Dehalococcoidia bacterium]